MSTNAQVPYTPTFNFAAEFAENPEPRCPCVLVLDTSGSMGGQPIAELNAGIEAFKHALIADSLAMKRVEVAIITFGPVQRLVPFQTADVFQPPYLDTTGDTPMGAALLEAMDMIEERKALYSQNGVQYYRPWVFLVTDGAPTDDWVPAATRLRGAVDQKKLAFFAVGVEGADMSTLAHISPRQPVTLNGLQFREMFAWLSNSLGAVSRSSPQQETLALPPPTGWAQL
jgi:uncharacterized protein YegL